MRTLVKSIFVGPGGEYQVELVVIDDIGEHFWQTVERSSKHRYSHKTEERAIEYAKMEAGWPMASVKHFDAEGREWALHPLPDRKAAIAHTKASHDENT